MTARTKGRIRWPKGRKNSIFLTKLRVRELVLMGLITITAVTANLPHEYVEESLGVSHTPCSRSSPAA